MTEEVQKTSVLFLGILKAWANNVLSFHQFCSTVGLVDFWFVLISYCASCTL